MRQSNRGLACQNDNTRNYLRHLNWTVTSEKPYLRKSKIEFTSMRIVIADDSFSKYA